MIQLQKYIYGFIIILILTLAGGTIRWQVEKDWTTLSRDGNILAKEKWVVEAQRTFIVKDSWYDINVKCPKIIAMGGYETTTRCYYPDNYYEQLSRSLINTKIELLEDITSFTSIKKSPNYKYGTRGAYAGYLIESMFFDKSVTQEEEFPKSYTVSWDPSDTRNYRLIWRVENLKDVTISDGEYHDCDYSFGLIKINLGDSCINLEKAEIIDNSKIYFYFVPTRGKQELFPRLYDPPTVMEAADTHGDTGFTPGIAVGTDGIVHVAHQLSATLRLRYCNNTGGSWSCINATDPGFSTGEDASVTLDSNNKVHLTSRNISANGDVTYCNNIGGDFACENIAGVTESELNVHAIDTNDKVHLAYYDNDAYDLEYCNNTGGSWNCQTVESTNIYGVMLSLEIDDTNIPHIAHMDYTNGAVRYCNATGGLWSCETAAESVGEPDIGLILDTNNIPHLAIHNTTSHDLIYCNKTGGEWKCEDVETTNDVGYDLSVDRDSKGDIYISHYDNTNDDLRLCNNSAGSWYCNKVTEADGNFLGNVMAGRALAIRSGRIADSTTFSDAVHIAWYNRTDLMYTGLDLESDYSTMLFKGDDDYIIGDTFVYTGISGYAYGGNSYLYTSNATDTTRHQLIKTNIEHLEEGLDITSAEFCMYIVINDLDAPTEGFNISSHHLYSNYTVDELAWYEGDSSSYTAQDGEPSYDTRPGLGDYNFTKTDDKNMTGGAGEPSGWTCWDVTIALQSSYSGGDTNFSLYFVNHDGYGEPGALDYVLFYSSEVYLPSYGPYLNITANFSVNIPVFGDLMGAGNPIELLDGTRGEYRNNTCQLEDWIYIDTVIYNMDSNYSVKVELEYSTDSTNYTMNNLSDIRFVYNITGLDYDVYTFKIWANDSNNLWYNLYNWTHADYEKIWPGDKTEWKKGVYLNCDLTNISYKQHYLIKYNYTWNQTNDRALKFEQATDGTVTDSGSMIYAQPDAEYEINCNSFIGTAIYEQHAINTSIINNSYIHVWWATDTNQTDITFYKETGTTLGESCASTPCTYRKIRTTFNESKLNISLDFGQQATYALEASYIDFNLLGDGEIDVNDNDINVITFLLQETLEKPSVISTANYSSFVIFNLPDNATLKALDSDGDGLSDFNELFRNYTDPSDADTDNGGEDDKDEIDNGRNPLLYGDDAEADSTSPIFNVLLEAGNKNANPFGEDNSYHFYRNGTKQIVDWMYIEVNITDADNIVNTTLLEWKNSSGWYNVSMDNSSDIYFVNMTELKRYEFYTFNIWANDSAGNMGNVYNWTYFDWEASWPGTKENWRKYAGINYTTATENFTYRQFYIRNASYTSDQYNDRALHNEQLAGATIADGGYLSFEQPTSSDERNCDVFTTHTIDETMIMNDTYVNNSYFHVWWASDGDSDDVPAASGATRFIVQYGNTSSFGICLTCQSAILFDGVSNFSQGNVTLAEHTYPTYYLKAQHLDFPDGHDRNITSNDVNTLIFVTYAAGSAPSVISTANYSSFIIYNVPDNATLKTMDSDSDGSDDWHELYINFTDPLDSDTDNDGTLDNVDCIGYDYQNASDCTALADADVIPPNTTLYYPTDYLWNNSLEITFEFNSTTNDDFAECALWTNETSWSEKSVNTSTITNHTLYIVNETFEINGIYAWNIKCADITGNTNFSSYNRTIQLDITPPLYNGNGTNNTNPEDGEDILIFTNFTDPLRGLNYTWCGNNFTTNGWINSTLTPLNSIVNYNQTNVTTIDVGDDANICWQCYGNDSLGNFNQTLIQCLTTQGAADVTSPVVTLENYVNASNSSATLITFGAVATEINPANCTLWGNWSGTWKENETIKYTNGASFDFTAVQLSTNPNSDYLWNVECNDTSLNEAFAADNFTFYVDTRAPEVHLVWPHNNTLFTDRYTIDFIYNVSDNASIKNCSVIFSVTINESDTDGVLRDENQTISITLPNANYTNWTVNCTDYARNTGASPEVYNITIYSEGVIELELDALSESRKYEEGTTATLYYGGGADVCIDIGIIDDYDCTAGGDTLYYTINGIDYDGYLMSNITNNVSMVFYNGSSDRRLLMPYNENYELQSVSLQISGNVSENSSLVTEQNSTKQSCSTEISVTQPCQNGFDNDYSTYTSCTLNERCYLWENYTTNDLPLYLEYKMYAVDVGKWAIWIWNYTKKDWSDVINNTRDGIGDCYYTSNLSLHNDFLNNDKLQVQFHMATASMGTSYFFDSVLISGAYPSNISIYLNNILQDTIYGTLEGHFEHIDKTSDGYTDKTVYFTDLSSQIVYFNVSSNEMINLTFKISGDQLSSDNFDYEETFNSTDNLTIYNGDAPYWMFDNINTSISGRWHCGGTYTKCGQANSGYNVTGSVSCHDDGYDNLDSDSYGAWTNTKSISMQLYPRTQVDVDIYATGSGTHYYSYSYYTASGTANANLYIVNDDDGTNRELIDAAECSSGYPTWGCTASLQYVYTLEQQESGTWKVWRDGTYLKTTGVFNGEVNIEGHVGGSCTAWSKSTSYPASASSSGYAKIDYIKYAGVGPTYHTDSDEYNSTFNIESEVLWFSSDNVSAVLINWTEYSNTGDVVSCFLSNDNKTTLEPASNNAYHYFSSIGQNVSYKCNGTISNNETPLAIANVVVKSIAGYPDNVTFDLTNDGAINANFTYKLNSSGHQINFTSSETLNSVINWIDDTCTTSSCLIPMSISTEHVGVLNIYDIDYVTDSSLISINTSDFEANCTSTECNVSIIFNSTPGKIDILNYSINYKGTGNITLNVHESGKSSLNYSMMIRYSKFNMTYPRNIDYYIPQWYYLQQRDIYPLGQEIRNCNTSTIIKCKNTSTSIFNFTADAATDNFTLYVRLKQGVTSLLNITINNDTKRTDEIYLNSTAQEIFTTYLINGTEQFFSWMDSTYTSAPDYFSTDFCFISMCEDCVLTTADTNNTDDYCHQPSSNGTSYCGATDTGTLGYCCGLISGCVDSRGSCTAFYDGSYDTYSSGFPSGIANISQNFTLPSDIQGALWEVKAGWGIATTNHTIPLSCLSYDPEKLILQTSLYYQSHANGSCYDGEWQKVYNTKDINDINAYFYSSSIWFDTIDGWEADCDVLLT